MADKKDNGITDFMHKPESPTLKELIAITIFITSLILTMQFPISLYLALVTMGVLLIVEEIIRRKSVEEKQFFKALSKIGLALWAFLVIMIIIDHALTYLAVHHLVIAQEKNPFLKMLWDNHGYLIGEIIALVYASAIIIPLNISLRSKNKHLVIGAFTVVLLALIVWALVVCNNISILLDYLL